MNSIGNTFNRQRTLSFKDKLGDYKLQDNGTLKNIRGGSDLSPGDKIVIINPESISVPKCTSIATYTRPAVIATISELTDENTMICEIPVNNKKNIKKNEEETRTKLVNEKTEFFSPKGFFNKMYSSTKIAMDSTNTALERHYAQCKKSMSRLDEEITQKKKEKEETNKAAEDISRFKKTIAQDQEALEELQASL